MYYNQNNRSKVVLRDFYLSRFENGAITEPCGTPEYLGMYLPLDREEISQAWDIFSLLHCNN